MIRDHYLSDVRITLEKYKRMAEGAIAQVPDHLFDTIDDHNNSIAVVMKHMAGNMRSRWTDFLTTDGEKPDRHRDTEFEIGKDDSHEALMAAWEAGWSVTLEAIGGLGWEDLEKSVTIRGEPHTVIEAINRQLTHYAYHVGQIVMLAHHFAGDGWHWLSIPPGKSADYEVSKRGETYEPEDGESA